MDANLVFYFSALLLTCVQVDNVEKSVDFGLRSYCVSDPTKKVAGCHTPAIGKYSNSTLGYVYGKCIP